MLSFFHSLCHSLIPSKNIVLFIDSLGIWSDVNDTEMKGHRYVSTIHKAGLDRL